MLWRTTLAVLFILVAAGSLGVWHFTAPADSRPSIQLAASVVVAGAAIYTLYLRVETRRATSASRFIERWNDQSFADLRARVSDVLTKKLDPKEATQEQRTGIFMISDFFEEMSIAVHGGGVKGKGSQGVLLHSTDPHLRSSCTVDQYPETPQGSSSTPTL